jgi:hypothetical protein
VNAAFTFLPLLLYTMAGWQSSMCSAMENEELLEMNDSQIQRVDVK